MPEGAAEFGWLVDCIRGMTGAQSIWLHVNKLADHDIVQALRASAALPVISPPQAVAGVRYRDGGLGDNTPIRPLLDHEHCDLFVVTHLKPGALWDAHEYAAGRIVEVRPSEGLHADGLFGGARAMTDFSAARLERLQRLGFEDAQRIFDQAGLVFGSIYAMRSARDTMLDALRDLDAGDERL